MGNNNSSLPFKGVFKRVPTQVVDTENVTESSTKSSIENGATSSTEAVVTCSTETVTTDNAETGTKKATSVNGKRVKKIKKKYEKCGCVHLPRFPAICKAHVEGCPNKDGCKRDCGSCRFIRKSNKEAKERMTESLKRRGTFKEE